jgi:hypothetical protein
MRRNLATAAVLVLFLGAGYVSAQPEANRPGSLLIYPLISKTAREDTLICVTNTNTNNQVVPGYPLRRGDVEVKWTLAYAPEGSNTWNVQDGQLDLSPGDTYCALASVFANITTPFRGFMYMYADDPNGVGPIDFDFLEGEALIVGTQPQNYLFALPAIPFKSKAGDGTPGGSEGNNVQGWAFTDGAGPPEPNGRLDFNGDEYLRFPAILYQPFFLDQRSVPGNVLNDEIVLLLGRADGRDIITNCVGNTWDNKENNFSFATFTFICWTRTNIDALNPNVNFPEPRTPSPGQSQELFSGWIDIRGDFGIPVFGGPVTPNVPILGAFVHRADIGPVGFTAGTLLWWDGKYPNGDAFLNR